MRILAISGSLRRDSYNTMLLRAAEELAPEGVAIDLWDGLEDVPPYNEDHDNDGAPPAVARLRQAIAAADGVLFATPEYNGSIPGQLKTAVDWASRPLGSSALWGKPAAVVGASSGMYGAVWAQAELRKVLTTAGARVVEAEVAVGRSQTRFDERGRLVDGEIRNELREAGRDAPRSDRSAPRCCIENARKERGPPCGDPRSGDQRWTSRGASCLGPRTGRRETRRPPRWLGDSP